MRIRTSTNERSTVLREIDLFSSCSRKELARISPLCSMTSAQSGEILTKQGGHADEFFVIVDGETSVWRNGLKIAKLGKGSFFGEMAILEGNQRTATVVAETDVRLLVLSRTEFRSLALVAPTVIRQIMVGLSARLRHVDELITDDSAIDRLQVL